MVEPLQCDRPRPGPHPLADDSERGQEAAGTALAVHQGPDGLPVRPTRRATSRTDTRSWSTRRATAMGTALVTCSTQPGDRGAAPEATIFALTVVTPPGLRKARLGTALETASWEPRPAPRRRCPLCRYSTPALGHHTHAPASFLSERTARANGNTYCTCHSCFAVPKSSLLDIWHL